MRKISVALFAVVFAIGASTALAQGDPGAGKERQTRLHKERNNLPQPKKDHLQAELGGTMTRQANGLSPGKSDAETAGASSPAGSPAMKKDESRRATE